jgi:hypothetical protein
LADKPAGAHIAVIGDQRLQGSKTMFLALLTTAAHAASAFALTAFGHQSRAETWRSACIDPRILTDHMRRDLGLLDGHEIPDGRQYRHVPAREDPRDLFLTRSAS